MLPLVVAAVLMRFLPESPRYLARHPERWPELERILRQIGHTVPAGSRFVDLGEKAAPRASVGALFTPDFRRDTVALWGAMFACMLAVYTAFNWVPAMLAGAGLGLSVASNGIARVQSRRRRRRSLRRTGDRAHRLEADHALHRGRGRRRRRGAWP